MTWEELIKKYVPLGTFWTGDWDVPEGNLYAQTTGRDRLELLRKSTYNSSEVKTNVNIHVENLKEK